MVVAAIDVGFGLWLTVIASVGVTVCGATLRKRAFDVPANLDELRRQLLDPPAPGDM